MWQICQCFQQDLYSDMRLITGSIELVSTIGNSNVNSKYLNIQCVYLLLTTLKLPNLLPNRMHSLVLELPHTFPELINCLDYIYNNKTKKDNEADVFRL